MIDEKNSIVMKDSETGGRWYVTFPDGKIVVREFLRPVYDENGKIIYRRYLSPEGKSYILLDE